MERKSFKYNMTLYYQSLTVYLVALIVYVLLRLQFIGFDLERILKDSILYLFLVLIAYVLVNTIYYLLLRKEIIIENDKLIVDSKFKSISIPFENINEIKIKRERGFYLSSFLRTVVIKLKQGERRSLVIRPFDYENEDELMNEIINIKNKLEQIEKEKHA